jgi:DNA-binding LytR/AlgR family response regulator
MQNLATFYTSWKRQSTRISLEELMFVEIMEDSCVLQLREWSVISDDSAEKIMSYLPEDSFLRVRNKYVINRKYVTDINDHYVYVGTLRIALRSGVQRAH